MRSLSPLVLLAFLATMLVACCEAVPRHVDAPPPAADTRTHAERADAMSVSLLDSDGDPNCGGVWVAETKIVTAYHCIDDAGKPAVSQLLEALGLDDPYKDWSPIGQPVGYQLRNGDHHSAVVKAFDMDHDLALLEVLATDVPEHDITFVSDRFLHDGEELDVVGSTAGKPFTYSRCYVASGNETDGFLQVSGPIYFGNSGGGAFDEGGHLVGIADKMIGTTKRGLVPDMAFFITGSVIRTFVASAG